MLARVVLTAVLLASCCVDVRGFLSVRRPFGSSARRVRLPLFRQDVAACRAGTATRSFAARRSDGAESLATPIQTGAYRRIHDRIWNRLRSSSRIRPDVLRANDLLQVRQSPARGFPNGTVVQLSAMAYTSTDTSTDTNADTSTDTSTDTKSDTSAGTSTDTNDVSIGVIGNGSAHNGSCPLPVRYIRSALLETVATDTADDGVAPSSDVSTDGIQVLNFVVFPSLHTDLPVWGADLVSLPGNKHLWLLDAQPMIPSDAGDNAGDNNRVLREQRNRQYQSKYEAWYRNYVYRSSVSSSDDDGHDDILQTPTVESTNGLFPWGGDLPDPVRPYVSRFALWARHTAESTVDVPDVIATDLETAVLEHLDLYLQQLSEFQDGRDASGRDGSDAEPIVNHQKSYIEYRKSNDPAKPMLKALFGAEYTDRLLEKVLFPSL